MTVTSVTAIKQTFRPFRRQKKQRVPTLRLKQTAPRGIGGPLGPHLEGSFEKFLVKLDDSMCCRLECL